MTDHPITPPPELVEQWNEEAVGTHFPPYGYSQHIATRAAQYGADQELEACCEFLRSDLLSDGTVERLRAARRPKPPSLKEQALAVLESVAVHELYGNATADNRLSADDMRTIRLALEALPDD
jgi:hypothetical protein